MSGFVSYLDSLIGKLNAAKTIAVDVAKEAAPEVLAAAQANAAKGVDSTGRAWLPTKAGNKPLRNAAAAITTRAVGTVLQLVLTGHHVYHSLGAGEPKRQIIPDRGEPIPDYIRDACKRAALRVVRRKLGAS
jgi:hypothetical protein